MSHLVKEVMSSDVVAVEFKCSIKDALGKMLEHQVRHLPVVEDGKLRGMVNVSAIRDYALPLSDDYCEPGSPRVRLDEGVYTIMEDDVYVVTEDTPLLELIDYFLESGIGAVPVVAAEGNTALKGIVSYIDVLQHARSFYQ